MKRLFLIFSLLAFSFSLATAQDTLRASFSRPSWKTFLNLSGTNSGDITLSGSPNYLTISGQAITLSAIDLGSSNASGTLAAGRFPALSGDISTSAGSLATAIGANKVLTAMINNAAVTLAKIANASANSKLLGSGASGSGAAYTEITLGSNLSMSGTTLNVTGLGAGTVTSVAASVNNGLAVSGSPITTSGTLAFSIANGGIGDSSLASTFLKNNQTITLSSDVTGSGSTAITATIASGAVTLAKMANMATSSLIYRRTAGTGVPEVNTLAQLKTDFLSTGLDMGSQRITSVTDPVSAQDAATKNYVDNTIANFDSKPAVAYASTSALPANTYNNGSSGVGATLTGNANGPLLIDGVTLVIGQAGERVLVAGESTQANNGWYTITQVGVVAVSPYILTRATESDQSTEIGAGYLTSVIAPNTVTPGSSNNGKVFISVAADPFTVGTTALTFSQVGAAYSAGTGLTLSGNTFSLTAPVTVSNGGTGLATLTNHSILLGAGTSAINPLSVGASGTLLQGVASSDPTFTATPTLGVAASVTGSLKFANATGSNVITIQAPASPAATTYVLPAADGTAHQGNLLQTDGSGGMTWGPGIKHYTVTASVDSNSNTETDLISMSIPAGDFLDGDRLLITFFTTTQNTGGVTPTNKIYWNGNSATACNGSVGSSASIGQTERALYVRRVGSSFLATWVAPANAAMNVDNFSNVGGGPFNGGVNLTSQTFTGTATLKVTWTWASAAGTSYIRAYGAQCYKFSP